MGGRLTLTVRQHSFVRGKQDDLASEQVALSRPMPKCNNGRAEQRKTDPDKVVPCRLHVVDDP